MSLHGYRLLPRKFFKELFVIPNSRLTRIARLTTLGLALASAAPVHASQQALMELFKLLRDKGSLSEAEYGLLLKAAEADAKGRWVDRGAGRRGPGRRSEPFPPPRSWRHFRLGGDGRRPGLLLP